MRSADGRGDACRFALKFLDDESMDKLEAAMAAETPKVRLWQRIRSRA
ncbi:MAG: hypothetical protein ACLU0O_07200 [Collinsella sp.]